METLTHQVVFDFEFSASRAKNRLKSELRFQGIAALNWSDEDIDAVTHYLNDTIYRFPESQARR